jgi:hypothetical protein
MVKVYHYVMTHTQVKNCSTFINLDLYGLLKQRNQVRQLFTAPSSGVAYSSQQNVTTVIHHQIKSSWSEMHFCTQMIVPQLVGACLDCNISSIGRPYSFIKSREPHAYDFGNLQLW